jgi:hypothetical protein
MIIAVDQEIYTACGVADNRLLRPFRVAQNMQSATVGRPSQMTNLVHMMFFEAPFVPI